MHAQDMIGTHPLVHGQTDDALIGCIEACCSCANACPTEDNVRL